MQQQQQQQKKPQYMEDFFREVDSIKADIDAVSVAAKEIAKINEQSMRATTTSEENKLSKKLKPLIDATNKRAKRTKTLLGLLKEETDKLQSEEKLNASDVR
jgi:predicted kinase